MLTVTYARVWTWLAGVGAAGAAVVGVCSTPIWGLAPLGALVGLAAVAGALLARGSSPAPSFEAVGRQMLLFAAGILTVVGLGHLGPLAVVAALMLLAGSPPVVLALGGAWSTSGADRRATWS